jgi:hypothetical protein
MLRYFWVLGIKSYISHICNCEVDIALEKLVRTYAGFPRGGENRTNEGLHKPRTRCTGR